MGNRLIRSSSPLLLAHSLLLLLLACTSTPALGVPGRAARGDGAGRYEGGRVLPLHLSSFCLQKSQHAQHACLLYVPSPPRSLCLRTVDAVY